MPYSCFCDEQVGEAWLDTFWYAPESLYDYHDETLLQYRRDLSLGELGVPQTIEEVRRWWGRDQTLVQVISSCSQSGSVDLGQAPIWLQRPQA